MLEQTELLHDIHVDVKHITPFIVSSMAPHCAVCGGSITERDGVAICITVIAGNKLEWYHDTVNCFERYVYSLALYFNNYKNQNESEETIQ